jgi:glycosyltransferase involved in cell wall biosynthesis
MKIHILYNFREQPWGGGNQFLKALKKTWEQSEIYTELPDEADAIIFNSFPSDSIHYFFDLFKLKRSFPNKLIVYRLNGPYSFIRGNGKMIDYIIALFNKTLSDGIIFQSSWCKKNNDEYFGIKSKNSTVIFNASDDHFFYPRKEDYSVVENKKINLIAVSWSSNMRKGFPIYEFLDQYLDFTKYEMVFVGNSPIPFKQIKSIDPVESKQLGEILRQQDIYITASQNDPCSNSLIEALSCGLPAVVLNDGGHPELVAGGGETFNSTDDLLDMIEKVASNLQEYQKNIPEFSIDKVAKEYLNFILGIQQQVQQGNYQPKKIHFKSYFSYLQLSMYILIEKVLRRLDVKF